MTDRAPLEEAPAGDPAGAIEVLYIDGCPHWSVTQQRLQLALKRLGLTETVRSHKVTSDEEAEQLGLHGSPTILIDGRDPFAVEGTKTSMSCRLYCATDGLTGVPALEELEDAIRRARRPTA